MQSIDNQEYDRRPIEQMREEAVESTSLKGLISGIAEGCATLDVWQDCWRIRILDKPRRVRRGDALADQSQSPDQ